MPEIKYLLTKGKELHIQAGIFSLDIIVRQSPIFT